MLLLLLAFCVQWAPGHAVDVLIIGAGASGIISAHYFVQEGFNVTVVESSNDFGGTWAPAAHYPRLHASNDKYTWHFPDMSHETGVNDFPSQKDVYEYLHTYMEKFELHELVTYGVEVKEIARRPNTSAPFNFTFVIEYTDPARTEGKGIASEFEYVVVATGYANVPHVPVLPGEDKFHGVTVHTKNIRAELVGIDDEKISRPAEESMLAGGAPKVLEREGEGAIAGKRVVVVGGGPSAVEAATWAATDGGAKDVHVIARTLHWSFPRYIGDDDPEIGVINSQVLYSRFMDGFMTLCSEYFGDTARYSPRYWFLQRTWLGRMVRNLFWYNMMGDIVEQLEMPDYLVPVRNVNQDTLFLSTVPPEFYPLIHEEKIDVTLGEVTDMGRSHVVVTPSDEDEDPLKLQADIVIYATGFQSSVRPIVSSEIAGELFDEDGKINLFRGGHCPSLPGMTFNGFVHTMDAMLISALTARWAVEYAKGDEGALHRTGALVDQAALWTAIEAAHDWEDGLTQSGRSTVGNSGYCPGIALSPMADAIMRDLGLEFYRGFSWGHEFLGSNLPWRYRELQREVADPHTFKAKPYDPLFLWVGPPLFFVIILNSPECWCCCGSTEKKKKKKKKKGEKDGEDKDARETEDDSASGVDDTEASEESEKSAKKTV